MNYGKITGDFETYILNLQRSLQMYSVGDQLGSKAKDTRARRALILNPYEATIAQMGICRLSTTSSRTKRR